MRTLSRQVEYALMALNYLSSQKQGKRISVREIANKLGLPFDPLSRVMQKMGQAGWLDSGQGLKGGYLLIKELSKISFLELSETLNGKLATVKCLAENGFCELESHCNIQDSSRLFHHKLKNFYESINIDDLLNSKQTKDKRYG